MKYRILHITDFHIDSPAGEGENLRTANFKPFINNLTRAVKNKLGNDSLDYIVTTGDYVNVGKVENYEHCEKILLHLASKLSVDVNRVFTCIGNHDYNQETDKVNPVESRKKYYEFAAKFNSNDILYKEDLFRIIQDPQKQTYFLILDSTFGANGENKPSKIDSSDIDRLYLKIEELIPDDKPLFVLSHYPMDQPRKVDFVMEEDGWPEKHIWKSAYDLLFKLNSLRDEALTVYFHGDGHNPDFWSYSDKQHSFMTGMIGGKHEPTYFEKDGTKKVYNKTTEFKLIEFDVNGGCSINTFQFGNTGFNLSTNTGEWKINFSEPRYLKKITSGQPQTNSKADKEGEISEPSIIEERKFKDVKTEVISTSIEDAIIEEIGTHKLYSFGQHKTSSTYSSLGWVDIDSLMNNQSIFSRCVEKSRDWITKEIGGDSTIENSIFIGLDFWGSCIAAQTSVLTGVTNYCIATKSKGRYNVEKEKLEKLLSKNESKWKQIFLFSDVVSTGFSINNVAEVLQELLGTEEVKIISISVISDIQQRRTVEMNKFFKIATFCSKLRIPIVENINLPSGEILSPRLDIS